MHKLLRPVNSDKQPTSASSVQFLIICTDSGKMHLCYNVYIWAAPQLFINCALVGRCVIVSTTTLEVAGQRSLVLIFLGHSQGIRCALPWQSCLAATLICNDLQGLLNISMQLSLMV